VISKSDLVILVVSCSALAVGVFRWHQNTQDVSAITIPASANSRVIVEPIQNDSALPVFKTAQVPDTSTISAQPINVTSQTASLTANQPVEQTLPQPVPVVEVVVASANADALELGTHEVRSGDYLGKIASQYNTDVQTLRDLNDISGSVIQIGQEILYPL